MKNNFKYLLIFAIILLCALLLCSCNSFEKQLEKMSEKERGLAIVEKASYEMDNLSSYRSSASLSLAFNYAERISLDITSNDIMYAKGTDDHYEYREMKITSGDITDTLIEGFSRGKMFKSDGKTKVYSKLPIGEYLDHVNLLYSLSNPSNLNPPTRVACKKRTNEEFYRINFSGFDEEAIEYICTEVLADLPKYYESAFKVTDITVSTTVSLDYKLTSLKFELEHESLVNSIVEFPVIEASFEYTDHNAVEEEDIERISFDDYKDVSDLRLLDLAKMDVDAIVDSSCMDFESSISTTGYNQVYTGRLDNLIRGLEFEIKQGSQEIKYRNGQLLTGSPTNIELGEYEAKQYLKTVIILISFSYSDIVKCEVSEAGDTRTYTFTYNGVDDSLTSGLNSSQIESQSATLTIVLTNGEVTEFLYKASIYIKNYGTIPFTIKITFTYYE